MAAKTESEAVQTTHPAYDDMVDTWAKMRRVVEGEDAIKAAGEIDLPRLPEEETDEYDARKKRATVYEATDKTMDALLGALFRKPGVETIPEAAEAHKENIDFAGSEYEGFRQEVAAELLEVGRVGVFIDWSETEKRPIWVKFDTEQIRNWSERVEGGKRIIDQIILYETVTERDESGFGSAEFGQYRVLELNEEGVYVSRIFELDRNESREGRRVFAENMDRRSIPDRQGITWDEIPFVTFGQLDLSPWPRKPPLLPIANLQLDHYRLDVDMKHDLHQLCMGGLFVIGDSSDEDGEKRYYLGGTRANKLSLGADAKFVEKHGAGTGLVREEKRDDEQRMALLGVRMLSAPKRAAEAAETLKIQREGETASLSTISYMLSLGLARCWRFHCRWMGLDETQVEIALNRDFSDVTMTPEMAAAQLAMVQSGKLSTQTFLENLFEGEIAAEDEAERIAKEDAEMEERERQRQPDPGPTEREPADDPDEDEPDEAA